MENDSGPEIDPWEMAEESKGGGKEQVPLFKHLSSPQC